MWQIRLPITDNRSFILGILHSYLSPSIIGQRIGWTWWGKMRYILDAIGILHALQSSFKEPTTPQLDLIYRAHNEASFYGTNL